MSEGKIEQLIKQKRSFLRQTKSDYANGGNDMLDDVEAAFTEAKAEITRNLELTNCVREQEGEAAWRKECLGMFEAWYTKWFGKA
jgi:hypothetical protein